MAGPIGGGGNSTPVSYVTYAAAGITFAKATPENIAVANTIDAAADSLTDVFSPVTLATGKITTAATNSTLIEGTATAFLTDFNEGDFLFYYTANASPVLLGKILSVDTDAQITLTANSPVAISSPPGAYCGKINTVISAYEEILIRIPVVPLSFGPTGNVLTIAMPYWNGYREAPPQPTSNNLISSSSMSTYSKINNPSQIGTVNQVPFTITAIYNYPVAPGTNTVFATSAFFPNYAYALLNPYGNSSVQNLAANTLYKMFANENFQDNGIRVNTNYPFSNLRSAGY
jgi:hypothetical protein